ncbi:MAG TPA: hypothetical protein VN086_02400 [Candidatus Paceibacterota bacterium]|nr:hypothetical protein [Candidatus Paceibacterota bacterium]
MVRRALIAFLLLIALTVIPGAHAQISSTNPLDLELTPQYPSPYQIVTVTPSSSMIDLSASTLTFKVNGKIVQQGSGATGASIAVGGPGSVTTVTVTAVNNGNTYTQSITIRPADVALVVEPVSTTHPFYEGASLIGSAGNVRIIAMPDLRTSSGAQISPANLVYTWKNGDQVLQSSSGIGKSVLAASAPVRYRDTVVTVTVSSQDSSVVGQAAVRISPGDPVIRIYENDPLLGPRYETALSNTTTLADSEATYRAVPYYFTSLPSLTWQVNGTPSQTGQDITVRPSGNGKGTAVLGVSASSGTLGQAASANLSVTFGKQSTGLFGL